MVTGEREHGYPRVVLVVIYHDRADEARYVCGVQEFRNYLT
jgi:hypothetical protein